MTVKMYLFMSDRKTKKKQETLFTYSFISGTFFCIISMQLVRIVSMTNVLKSECVNIRITARRMQLNGENI